MLLRNRLYVGVIDVPDFGVRDQRGDFDRLISEEIFYKAQGRSVEQGAGRRDALTITPYYHCRPGCRGLNVTKTKLEGLFVDELAHQLTLGGVGQTRHRIQTSDSARTLALLPHRGT